MNRRDGERGTMTRWNQGGISRPMGQINWNPWQEIQEMRQRMDDMFSSFFGGGGRSGDFFGARSQEEPDVDVYDNGSEYLVHAALPGVQANDINLEATDDGIHLTCECGGPMDGERSAEQSGEPRREPTPLRQSRYASRRRFEFAYSFPEEIKPDQTRAEFRNGRLELRIPKARDTARSRTVTIPVAVSGTEPAKPMTVTSPPPIDAESAAKGESRPKQAGGARAKAA